MNTAYLGATDPNAGLGLELSAIAAAPATTPSSIASGMGKPKDTLTPITAALSASTEPTERSMPPQINTSVIPTVTKVSAGSWFRIAERVPTEQKLSVNREKTANKTPNVTSTR